MYVEVFLNGIEVKENQFWCKVFRVSAFVITKKAINVKNEFLTNKLRRIKNTIAADSLEYFSVENRRLFLHELWHVFQQYRRPWYNILWVYLRDIFKSHSKRELEIGANKFSEKHKHKDTKELYKVIEEQIKYLR